MGNALLVRRLRRGGPSDVVCLNKGEGGISLFPPIAIVSFLLTSSFAQDCVARWLRVALGPWCTFRSAPETVVSGVGCECWYLLTK
jgi:hypothetical protein